MDRKKPKKHILSPRVAAILIGILTYALLFTMLAVSVTPEQYDLRAGQASPLTITATKDVEDTVTTQQLVDEAVAAVQPSYRADTTVEPVVMENLHAAFSALEAVRAREDQQGEPTREDYTKARAALSPLAVSDEQLTLLFSMDAESLSSLRDEACSLAQGVLVSNLAEGQEAEAVSKLCRDLMNEGYAEDQVELARLVVGTYLQPNIFLDEEATQANRQKAADSVESIVYIKGRNIVKSGEIITKAQIAMLDSLGLLKNKRLDVFMYLGIALLLAMMGAAVITYLLLFGKELLDNLRILTLLGVILVVTTFLCMFMQRINVYLMPVVLGAMLTALLISCRLALIVNIVLAVITSLMASGSSSVFTATMFAVLLSELVSGSLSLIVLRRKQQRISVLTAGLLSGASAMLTTFACGLINSADTYTVLESAGWAGLGGLVAALLCIGLQPALEWMFNLVTTTKLLELSNPNHPLIRRLILEASGTYHHSIIVANLSEAAANSIGANGLLARVGAYYHDVGKLKRPLYFKENQMGDNPHDRTDPLVSAAILTSHPKDGIALAQKARMPKAILDIIEQHHGDTPVVYFYDRALKQYGPESTHIEDFRYAGPKPQSAEAAIVMLADSIEAAARSMQEPTPDKMNALIHKLVRAKMDDGQLDESPLTMRDLERICAAFMTVLHGVFHERVEYPTVNITRVPGIEAGAPETPQVAVQAAPQPAAQTQEEAKNAGV